jgi:hypothetical protein
MIRSQSAPGELWLIAISALGMSVVVAMTRAVNVPLNNQLMTWVIESPPDNLREIWAPWDRVNTIRTLVAGAALILEAVALSLSACFGRT